MDIPQDLLSIICHKRRLLEKELSHIISVRKWFNKQPKARQVIMHEMHSNTLVDFPRWGDASRNFLVPRDAILTISIKDDEYSFHASEYPEKILDGKSYGYIPVFDPFLPIIALQELLNAKQFRLSVDRDCTIGIEHVFLEYRETLLRVLMLCNVADKRVLCAYGTVMDKWEM